jgi:hypothetical protein
MARKISEAVRQQREALRARIEWVLDHLYGGNQRRMAAAMGQDQAYLSRIINGRQAAGPAFLEALYGVPLVNPPWLVEGVGEPLLPPTRGTLPVSNCVLPGSPQEHANLLSGSRHPVADALDRESRYWLRTSEMGHLVSVPGWGIHAGDLLLLESSPEWTRRPDVVAGRLCGVFLGPSSAVPYEVGWLLAEGPCWVLWVGRRPGRSEPAPRPPDPEPSPRTEIGGRSRRKVLDLDKARERPARRRQEKLQTQDEARLQGERSGGLIKAVGNVAMEDVVAVCLALHRPELHWPGSGGTP